MTHTITINSTTELPKAVDFVLDFAQDCQKFLLVAEMGSGKTTFVAAFCKHLGVNEETSSPTFSLVNEYDYADGIIRHIDLYRLKKVEEALDFGIEDYFYDSNYLFIEWPEILESILPDGFILVKIKVNEDKSRTFSLAKIH